VVPVRRAGSASWCISEDRWPESFDVALWFRAAERIDVAAGGVVPGEPDVEPRPDPGTDPADAAELAAGWLAWWQGLIGLPPRSLPVDQDRRTAWLAFSPPDYAGLAAWPALRRAVTGRWRQAHDWHAARKRAGLAAGQHLDPRTGQVVAALERELGRGARPFSLKLVVLPVRDEQVRPAGADRYLVPERLYDGPGWPGLLRGLLIPRA
jgi:hypothetical protein